MKVFGFFTLHVVECELINMSRIGKMPVEIPDKVNATLGGNELTIKGPLGTHSLKIDPCLDVQISDGKIFLKAKDSVKTSRSRHGLMRVLVQNIVSGVSVGFKKELDIVGVGYRAEVRGKDLNLTLGYSHPIIFPIPEGIKIHVEKATRVTISGSDKQLVGETAAQIRQYRTPEPYKGKGIKYSDEIIIKKAGKTVSATSSGGK